MSAVPGPGDRLFLGEKAAQAIESGDPGRIRRDRPLVPPETCPLVDRASTRADAIAGDLGTIREGLAWSRSKVAKEAAEEIMEVEAQLAGLRLLLEDLRVANEQLRRSSFYWRRAFDSMTETVS